MRGILDQKKKKTYNNGYVDNSIGHLPGVGGEKWDNELAKSGTEWVRETWKSRRSDAATFREPQIRVTCRGTEHKGLSQTNENLPEHDDAIITARSRVRTSDTHHIAHDREEGRRDDRRLWTPVQHVDG